MELEQMLLAQRAFFDAGNTRSYDFRLTQLKKLKQSLLQNEQQVYAALAKDLGKGNVESYVTELGLVLTDLGLHIRKLKHWMKPQRRGTNLLNLPSSTRIHYDPLGVVLIIAPWNYPFQLLMNPLIGAISGGNCVVLKPSEMTSATEALVEKMIADLFPVEYIRVVKGDGAQIVPALMNSFRFDHVFFTGSIPVGKAVYEMAARKLVPVTLELGGKSPAIVHSDADLDVAAKRIAMGKWINAGQTCIAPDYVLVQAEAKEEFTEKLKSAITSFYGDAASSADYGRIINSQRMHDLEAYLQEGRVIFGGKYDSETRFFEPTLMDEIVPGSNIMKQEIFGPILPIISFDSREVALQTVLQNSHPLATYLFTNDRDIEQWWMERVSFGGGCVNNTVYHFANDRIPFGGIGNSGIGAYHGRFSFYTFTHAKPVLKTPNWFEPAFKYPPFTARSLKLFKWVIR